MSDITVRRLDETDLDDVLDLLHLALGWEPTDRFRRYFDWKHRSSPFGDSPGWIALDGGQIVGVRLFQRWELAAGGATIRAVRAVDTATHPEHRGRGIFRTLTMAAVEELTADGVGFVFNTPNDKSMPGYLKMGWVVGGRLPVGMLPAPRPRSLLRLRSARTGAERWPLDTDVGEPATFSAGDGTDRRDDDRLRIVRTPAYLTWRYGWPELGYRRSRIDGADLVWRLRRRGEATELTLSDSFGASAPLAPAKLLRSTGADVALGHRRPGLLPAPRLGPIVTLRPLAEHVAWDDLRFTMGDIELF
ncbi:MAG: GNAT family N-acetyltransferase [Actinomycetota bacterium]